MLSSLLLDPTIFFNRQIKATKTMTASVTKTVAIKNFQISPKSWPNSIRYLL